MQYLMGQTPDISSPRPHELVIFGPLCVIFRTSQHDPGQSMAQSTIRREAFDTASVLRPKSIQRDKICREGSKKMCVDVCALFKGSTTAKEYHNLQFSACNHGRTTYITFLWHFLEHNTSSIHTWWWEKCQHTNRISESRFSILAEDTLLVGLSTGRIVVSITITINVLLSFHIVWVRWTKMIDIFIYQIASVRWSFQCDGSLIAFSTFISGIHSSRIELRHDHGPKISTSFRVEGWRGAGNWK